MSTQPTTPNPFAMPMDDLAKAAGVNQPAVTEPAVPAAPAAPAAPVPVVPEAYTLTQDDSGVTLTLSPEYGGEVFKGKDLTEVLPKLAKAKADANAYIKQLKTQPVTTPEPVKPATPAEDPAVVATREWMLDELARGFGFRDKDELRARMGLINETTENMATNLAIADFHKMCPGYVDTPENSKIIGDYFPENFGRFPSAQELKQAYALAVVDGKITPKDAQAAPATQARPAFMPSSGSAPVTTTGDPWSMPLDQLAVAAGIK